MELQLANTENHVCIICYCNENFTLKCADRFCNTRICEECFDSYLDHCQSEKSLVKCLNQYCKSFIISESFNTQNTYFEKYKNVLLTAFMHSQGPEVKDKMMVSHMIEDLRKKKRQFVKSFPSAIGLVVEVALNKKFNDIGKQNSLYIKNVITTSNRVCMNSHCDGKLNKEFECMKCLTVFCQDCEKIKKKGHACKKEDIESMKLIATIMKCPKCSVPIERSEGCNGMTCASCKETFDYRTGEVSNHGSTNTIIAPVKAKFKFDFKQNYDEPIAKKLFIIEDHEAKEPSITKLNNVIQKLLSKEGDAIIVENNVLRSFEEYIRSKLNYINFINITITINELHQNDELTEEALDEILAKNSW